MIRNKKTISGIIEILDNHKKRLQSSDLFQQNIHKRIDAVKSILLAKKKSADFIDDDTIFETCVKVEAWIAGDEKNGGDFNFKQWLTTWLTKF